MQVKENNSKSYLCIKNFIFHEVLRMNMQNNEILGQDFEQNCSNAKIEKTNLIYCYNNQRPMSCSGMIQIIPRVKSVQRHLVIRIVIKL